MIESLLDLIEALQKASAPSAAHDSAQRYPAPKCTEGTRIELLARLTSWVGRETYMLVEWPAWFGEVGRVTDYGREVRESKASSCLLLLFAKGSRATYHSTHCTHTDYAAPRLPAGVVGDSNPTTLTSSPNPTQQTLWTVSSIRRIGSGRMAGSSMASGG